MNGKDSINIPCSICKVEISIYRCPACFERTCSLVCCLKHKEISGCNGKRNRVGFVPLHQYTDSTLSSDYHFLEDVLAKSERGKRLIKDMGASLKSSSQKSKKRKLLHGNGNSNDGTTNKESDSQSLPLPIQPLLQLKVQDEKDKQGDNKKSRDSATNHNSSCSGVSLAIIKNPILQEKGNCSLPTISLSPEEENLLAKYPPNKQRLVRQAHIRDIRLLLMAPGMQRHVMNKSTKYDTKKDLINWKVEFIIHSFSSSPSLKKTEKEIHCTNQDDKEIDSASSKVTLTSDRVPESEPISGHLSKLFERNTSHSAPSLTRSTLIHFCTSSNIKVLKDNVCALMKCIPCKSSQPSYRRVDLSSSLKDILKGTTVIEFPTIEIVMEEDVHKFPVNIQEI